MDTEPQTATDVAEDDDYAILFPGQGSQSVGMAGKVLEVYPGAEHWFQRANQILDYDLLDLIERGPAAQLDDTQHSQPAIFVASVAWLEALREKWNAAGRALTPTVVSGHSMGQITAMLAARALDFDEALRLVRRRGELMRDANLRRPGGMASIIGLRDRVLRSLVGEVGDDGTIVVANDNCPGQTVVSGDVAAAAAADAAGRGTRRAPRRAATDLDRLTLAVDGGRANAVPPGGKRGQLARPGGAGREQHQWGTDASARTAHSGAVRRAHRPGAVASGCQDDGGAGFDAVR